jgi:hypothetical protein
MPHGRNLVDNRWVYTGKDDRTIDQALLHKVSVKYLEKISLIGMLQL